jgi:class 3 adenylate cyclase
MPYFMDRHELGSASAEDVAGAHVMDLEVQQKYDVRYLSYWFDAERQAAFCLVDAPDEELAQRVHAESHGLMPNEIIRVEETTVDLFLGRVEHALDEPGPPQPSPFRTIFFSDIEGSTATTQRLGDDAAVQLLRIHDDIVRTVLAAHEGREVKHTGDGIMAAFASVTEALSAAVAVQQALDEREAAEGGESVRVRIGLAAGEPVAKNDDLFGAAVQLASRLCDQADAGEIVVSGTVCDLAIGKSFEFSRLEDFDLKGFPEPVRACRVAW